MKRLKLGNHRHGQDSQFFRNSWWGLGAKAVMTVGGAVMASQNKQKGAEAVPYEAVDPTQVQKNVIQGDLATLNDATTLANRSSTEIAKQSVANRNITQPGYGPLSEALSRQATDMAKDPYAVPQSVIDQLSQVAAEHNITAGTGAASGFSQNSMLRSLGVNALDYGQKNFAAATNALSILSGTAPNISPVSPLSFMLSPQQTLETITNNNTQKQAIAQGAENSRTAADNANSANLWDSITSATGSLTPAVGAAVTKATTPKDVNPNSGVVYNPPAKTVYGPQE